MNQLGRLEGHLALRGWDDEKVCFTDEVGTEWCVSDYPELVSQLLEICKDYFRRKQRVTKTNEAISLQRQRLR